MRKHISLIAVYLCLLLAFCCGMGELLFAEKGERVSLSENRMLKGFPELTGASLLAGDFMDGFESYLSDAFFLREDAAAFSDGIKGLFSLPAEEYAVTVFDEEQLAERGEEAAAPETLETGPAGESGEPAPQQTQTGGQTITESAYDWLELDDGTQQFLRSYTPEQLSTAAQALNDYRRVLPADGSVHMLQPLVSQIANYVLDGAHVTAWGSDIDEIMQPALDEGVMFHDHGDILLPYVGRYSLDLYPTEDHHWHPITVSLTVGELMREQGVVPNDFFEYGYYLSHYGTGPVCDRQALESMWLNRENVLIMEPVSPVESYLLNRITERLPSVFIDPSKDGYIQYLGGLRGPWRLLETGFHTGRTALVIGDSFVNCFTAYLAPYYDEVLVTDFRSVTYNTILAGASAQQYIEYYGVDDVYVVVCTATSIGGDLVQYGLEKYLTYIPT